MKQLLTIAGIILVCSFIPHNQYKSGIHGLIDPIDGAQKVWAISGTDSASAVPIAGKFSLTVKPGNWDLLVEAIKPLKNTSMNNVLVLENQSTDVGTIALKE